MITVLCVMENSNYYKIPGLDLWDINRDAYNFKHSEFQFNKIIAHPPCQQWGCLKKFAHENKREKELAVYCLELVQKNGGILEHPLGSTLFKECGITKGIIKVRQSWWGYEAHKETLLYFNQVKPIMYPITYDIAPKKVQNMDKKQRSKTPLKMCQWLVNCIYENGLRPEVIQKEYGF